MGYGAVVTQDRVPSRQGGQQALAAPHDFMARGPITSAVRVEVLSRPSSRATPRSPTVVEADGALAIEMTPKRRTSKKRLQRSRAAAGREAVSRII